MGLANRRQAMKSDRGPRRGREDEGETEREEQ